MDSRSTTLAILAGGAGSRMGTPKSLLKVHDRPILEYLRRRFGWTGPTLLVTTPGREQPPGHELFSREVTDPVPDLGPLRGLLSALEACHTPLLGVTTVDMPRIGPPHFDFLIESMKSRTDCIGLMLRRRVDGEVRIEPFPSIFRMGARGPVSALLTSDRRSVRALCEQPGFADIPAPADWPERTWTNLNFPEDLERFLREPL
jgi:molybdopterin-guanine dinucleotide biosynthesis protein A